MSEEFERLMYGEFFIDREYEIYYKAWEAYFEKSNQIDKGCYYPHPLIKVAQKEGFKEMAKVLKKEGIDQPKNDNEKWQRAKMEAVRKIN